MQCSESASGNYICVPQRCECNWLELLDPQLGKDYNGGDPTETPLPPVGIGNLATAFALSIAYEEPVTNGDYLGWCIQRWQLSHDMSFVKKETAKKRPSARRKGAATCRRMFRLVR